MLTELFDRPALGDSRYDSIVGSSLNDVAPNEEERRTRKGRLVQTWIALKRTDPPSTSDGKNKIDTPALVFAWPENRSNGVLG
jgi:hypothetical protein